MGDKLKELTDKLYSEGLQKGKQEAEELLEKAKIEAGRIVAEAKNMAAEIEHAAKKRSEEMKANADAEIKLAGRQVVSEVKQTLENLIITAAVSNDIKNAFNDIAFVQSLIKSAVEKFDLKNSETPDLFVIIPQEKQKEFSEYICGKVSQGLASPLEIKIDGDLKSGFKIGSKSDGYYISFTDGEFENLFKASLRSKVSELLFGNKL
ncbi:MAG: hypothetical protein LBG92_11905 [Prevotellaceae bacterium]|jgi:V/A-type H+-transporting ATPase subunit E|nr:hypothetical protein [Prevotellaceae bacterium]MDR0560862.1 hypothetical protein [Prevotellaceae bacterium]